MSRAPKFLVIDGYTKSARDELAAGGAAVAGVLYAEMLKQASKGSECDIVYPSDPDAALPAGQALEGYDGIAWTGCSLTVFHDIPEVRAQIDFARACFEAGVPAFGSCWAAQVAVVAAGGKCDANPNGREMGVARKIALTPEGRAHPLYEGKADVFDGFISHDDEITELPQGAVRLAGNQFTHVQSVSVDYLGGKFWGLQYHPEYDLHEMARLTWCRIDKLTRLGFFADRQAGEEHVALLEALHEDPARKDLAWVLGVDRDVMDEAYRRTEVRNWLKHLVLPVMAERR
ncbi:MAG: type 1 glutamine amidotransferase [Rhodospirillales bacterium]|nr:type 1 glutamine amidotransferase [Alphaproteobacteria bacterium]MBL6947555.1 type 1 glutamine amidotransferase [Rhodospirillales bacterium]